MTNNLEKSKVSSFISEKLNGKENVYPKTGKKDCSKQ